MNKKALKPIVITAIVLVLIAGAYLLMTLIPETGGEEPSPSPSASKASGNYSLFNEDYYSLKRMEFRFRDGSELRIDIDDSKDTRIFNLSPATPGWTYKQDLLRSTAFNMNSISAIAKVAENVTDFSLYELDDPLIIARAVFKGEDGEYERELHIGKVTAVQDSYYACMKGDDTVYAVTNYIVRNLTRTELDYRQLDFFPSYLDQETLKVNAEGFITYIRIRNPETDEDIEIATRSSDDLKNSPAGTSKYYMTIPVEVDCNDNSVTDKLVNVAAAIVVGNVVEDDPDDLSKYGLDDPLEIWMTNTDGTSVHYLIGDNEGSSAYLMVEGTNSVLRADSFSSSLRSIEHISLMFKLAWLHNIDDVQSIVYDLGGVRRLFEIRLNKKDEDNKVIAFKAVVDGRPILETNARRLYARTHSLMIMGETSDRSIIEGSSPAYTITINMKDGTSDVLRLYRLNERQYAVSVNEGDTKYFINASDVKKLLEGFDYIDRGEEMPR